MMDSARAFQFKGACLISLLIAVCAGCTSGQSADSPTSEPTMAPWKPSYTISVPTMSDAEAMSLRADELANLAALNGISDPPDVDLVRWTTMSDYGPTMASCLQEAGFYAIGAGSGFIFPDGISESQLSAYNMAEFECRAKYSLHPKYTQPLTEAQLGMLYDYWTQWLVPCEESLGLTPPAAPTKETFVAQRLQGQSAWDPTEPLNSVYEGSEEKTVQRQQTCPEYPTQYLWG